MPSSGQLLYCESKVVFMLLLITDRSLIARVLTERLSENGIFLHRAPYETARLNFERRDTGGVILDCIAASESPEALCAELRAHNPEMPIAAIVPKDVAVDLSADMLLRDGDIDQICKGAMDFCHLCGWSEDSLRVYSLSVGNMPNQVYYMGYPLPLAPREYVILRCLLYRMPRLTDADELMSLCFPGERLGIANLSVQISNINRRAKEIDPRPLIVNVYGKGYRLRDGL